MYKVIACLALEHHYGLLAVAATVCVIGSCLIAQTARRLVTASEKRKRFQISLAGLMGGATIWSTHFIAMLAYEPGLPHGYDPLMTAASLVLAIVGMLGVTTILGHARRPLNHLVGGVSFGITVATMHYVGMSAYTLPGRVIWDPVTVLVSVVLGALFGAAAFHRLVYPVTRFCWLGGAILLVLSICAMHFTGMTAFELELSPLYEVPAEVMSDTALGTVIVGVTSVIFAIGFMSINIELDVEREALAQLKTTAAHDALTGLPNRLALAQKLEKTSELLRQDRTLHVAVLTLDLDRFKEVNDLHGHVAGDAVLAEIAHRFSVVLGDDEFVARSGGDEFVALKQGFRRITEVKAFAERLKVGLMDPIAFGDISLFVGVSIGVATTLDDGTDLDDLLQKSDLAMYRGKEEINPSICLFNAEMDQQNRDRLLLVNDLRQAIERDQLELVYQLQNDVATRAPSGFEALLRWNHPERGRVSPGEFIPIAEETGLIQGIGLWVLRTACLEAAQWDRSFSVAVNVAPQQLAQPSFLEHLSDILMESRLPPERLELEVTEASIIDDQEYALNVMCRIKEMGVRIAMDDFGTGYSSLATLQAFPFDKIKIDRSFIQDVHLNAQRAAIVRATLLLGDALDIPVLAEGVEIESELAFLNQERCKYVQGFFFGRPLSLQDVRKIVRDTRQDIAS